MFYTKQINPIGCLLFTILAVWLFFKLKLYYIIIFIVVLAFAYNFYLKIKKDIALKNEEKERNFEPEIGEVYKVCQFCGNDVKRSAKICPHCQNMLE